MSLNINRQLFHLIRLGVNLVNKAVDFKTVYGEETQTITEDIQIVLVISLTLIQEPDLQFLLPLICGSVCSMFKDITKFLRIFSISSFVFRVLDKISFVDVVEVVDLLLIFDLAVVLNSIQIIIVEFSDQNFELICVLVQMNISNLLLSKSSGQLFDLLSFLFLLFVFLEGCLIFNINVLILKTPSNLLLHGILFLDHLPLQRDV